MKKTKILLIKLLVFLLVINMIPMRSEPVYGATLYSATYECSTTYGEETTVQNGYFYAGLSYGSLLRVRVKYDLPTEENTVVTNAILRITVNSVTNDTYNPTIEVCGSIEDNFSTYNTSLLPYVEVLDSKSVNPNNNYEFDVTSFVNQEFNGDGTVSFVIKGTDEIESNFSNKSFDSSAELNTANFSLILTTVTYRSPEITTGFVTDISSTGFKANASITDLGSPELTSHGVCWNTTGNPTISDSKIDDGNMTSAGNFISTISGLTSETRYYVKTYATNSQGTVYGSEMIVTTLEAVPPTISSLTPANDAVGVAIDTNLVVKFDEPIDVEEGNIYIKKTSDDTSAESIDIKSDQVTGSGTDTLTINPSVTLEGLTGYYIEIEATAIDDKAGNSYAGISDKTSWKFTTRDTSRPTVNISSTETSPSNSEIFPVTITFNENVTGFDITDISVVNGSAGNFSTSSGQIYTVDISPTDDGEVTINVGENVAVDGAGNNNLAATELSINSDRSMPVISSLTPANDAVGVATDTNLVVKFDEPIDVEEGNIYIKKTNDDTSAESIDIKSDQVTGSGTDTLTINPSVTLEGLTGYYIEIDATAIDDKAGNSYAGISDKTSWKFTTRDTSRPAVNISSTETSPSNSEIFPVTITFNEDVTGFDITDISVVNGSAGNFSASNGQIYTVDISPTDDGEVTINVGENVAVDGAGNNNLAATELSINSDRNMPVISSLTPANDAVGVATDTNLVVKFDEPIDVEEGNIYIKKTNDDTSAESIDIKSDQVTGSGTDTLTINPSLTLEGLTGYYIEIDATAIDDKAGNSYAGISDKTSWKFTTRDTSRPAVNISSTETSPSNSEIFPVTITFNENVTGFDITDISVVNGSAGNFSASNGQIYTVDISPTDDGEVTINVGENVAVDGAGNNNLAATELSITSDRSMPVISSLTPANDAVGVATDTNLVVKFDEAIDVEEGNIYIKKTSDDTSAESIDIKSDQVTGSGTDTLTINPSVTLEGLTGYYIEIDATAIDDKAGNSYAGISDKTSWKFTTRDISSSGNSGSNEDDSNDEDTSNQTNESDVIVIVNGIEHKAGTEKVEKSEGKTIVTLEVNSELVETEIENASKNSENENTENTVVVPIKTKNSNTVNAVLTGDIVDLMEKNDFNLSVVTENVEYIIPAEDITINKVAKQLQVKEEELVNIEVRVNIEDVEKKIVDSMMLEAADNNISIVFPPVSFNIEAITTDSAGKKQTVKVDTFSNYVQRVLEIPDDIDPSKITTGIVYNADGTFSHIPTYVYQENGKYYAKLNSKTNSSYSVVWNPIKVESVKNHWSQKSVEDLASRLIIDEIDHFMPDEEISRVEFTKYIIKGLGLYRSETSEKTDFSDVTEDMNVVVSTGVKYGIINGYDDGTFKPNKTISRQEAITIVRKAMKLVAPMQIDLERIEKYDDYDKIENWAFEATKIVVGAGVFNGKTNNVLDPNANMTYAETIQAIENLLIKANLINE